MTTKATDLTPDPQAGHYHDPLGTYDYCADPKCPRNSRDEPEQDPYAGEQRSGNLFDIAF